jgi:DNA polymerase I
MKLGSLFGTKPKTLAKAPVKKDTGPGLNLASILPKKTKPGEFLINWPKVKPQQVKDYKAILTLADLEAYLMKCEETGKAGFDWETAASDKTRRWYSQLSEEEQEEQRKAYLKTPLDPWKGDICTVSVAAAAHEARVVPISHKKGKVFEPDLSREEARNLVLETMDRMLFKNDKIVKVAANIAFESKYTAKYGRYILKPVADPLQMLVRCYQIVAPQKITNPKKPMSGWGLKPSVKKVFGVEMNDFMKLLEKHGVDFYDEIDASQGEGLLYSAEDSDYALQLYEYGDEIAKQIPTYEGCPNKNYSEWLHTIEMPFQRVIGLMEYWGMKWDPVLAQQKREEAAIEQAKAAAEIARIGKDLFDLDINPGKSGKTGDVKALVFDYMKIPVGGYGKTGPSMDKMALIDMVFMLENKLESLDEEKYLGVTLPEGWEKLDPETDTTLGKEERGAIRIAQRPEHPYKESGLRLIEMLQKIQKYSTLLSSHVDGREKYLNSESGRIHAGYSSFTDTGRCNSFSPNGQNVPGIYNDELGVRNMYVSGPGKIFFFIDFSGFELRLLAWKAGDEVMIDLFNTNGDMHRKTAAELTGKPESEIDKKERKDAKPANFGIAYGGTEHALQKTYKVDYGIRKTLDQCLAAVNAVKRAYKRVPEFQRSIAIDAREKGYVSAIYGYIRMLPGINSTYRGDRNSAERQAANTPIQGSAAEVMKKCQNEVYEAIGRQDGPLKHGSTDMIGQIHDEIVFESDDDPEVLTAMAAFVKSIMEQPPLPDFPVPIEAEAEVGYRWGQKMSIEEWLKQKGA